ncbi:MAG: class II fructose-bisphosphate aldolase [Candidatus Andersenbacteria bacterium]
MASGSVQLDWPRLAAIRRAVALPLVLHGGSGLRLANYPRAVAAGIATINFDTDLRFAFGTARCAITCSSPARPARPTPSARAGRSGG